MPPEHALVTFYFDDVVPIAEVDGTLQLSLMAAESIYGRDRIRLEAQPHLDPEGRRCSIDTATAVGRALAAIFLGYSRREFGETAVRISQGRARA